MRPTPWTEKHDRLLADTEPAVSDPDAAELDRIWLRAARSIETDRPRPRRTGVRIAIGAVVGAAVLGTSGLAAAQLYTARTGEGPVDAEDLSLGGPGEDLMPAAPDYAKVLAEEFEDIPFPSSQARAEAVADQVHDERFAGPDERSRTGAVRAWAVHQAMCSWSNQWAVATRTGDEAARAEAIEMIQAAPTWPAVTAIDPKPYNHSETVKAIDGDGHTVTRQVMDESHFFYLAALGKAVEGRKPAAVARVLARSNGYCRPFNVPDLPNADPMYAER